MTTTSVSSETPLTPGDDARRNLLLSFPELDVAHDGRDIVDALVEGAICHLLASQGAGKMLILADVAGALQGLAGLAYEPSELISAFERLERRGRLSFRDTSHRSFIYSEDAFHSTADALQRRMAAWDAVRTSWMDDIRHRRHLDADQSRVLWDALDLFATDLINAYSAEAAAFLYLNDERGQARFFEALQMRLPDLKANVPEGLLSVAEEEFPRFFDPSNAARTDYLTGRLRASFFFHLLSVDPTASQLVIDQVRGKTLYLDSNFLFRLIGFHGAAAAFTPFTVIEISKQLKCRLVVTRETVDEFIRVVRAHGETLQATPITRTAYLRVAAEHPSDEGEFIAAYYREFHSGQVTSPSQFVRKWSNIRSYLKEWGIEIDEDAYMDDEDRHDPAFLDELSRLSQWHGGAKKEAALEHDAAMLRIVREGRGRVDAASADVPVWLLTFDRQLTRYSAYYATEKHLPAVLMAEDWLQIARPFLPRTDDYAKSFVAMLRTPMLFHGSTKVPFAHMAEALSRLERYQELPQPVVAAMVADDQFTRNFLEAESEAAARKVIELTVGTLTADEIKRNESLREQVDSLSLQVSEITAGAESLRSARDTATRERDDARREAEDARVSSADFDKKLTAAVSQAATNAAEATKNELAPQIASRVSAARRWAAYFALCSGITLVGVAALVLRWGEWTSMQRTVVAVGVALAWVTLLLIPKGVNAALSVTANVGGVIGIVVWGYNAWSQAEKEKSSRAANLTRSPAAQQKPPTPASGSGPVLQGERSGLGKASSPSKDSTGREP